MAWVSGFHRLASLDVSGTNVTALGISQLRRLPALSILTLDGNQLRQLATAPGDSLPLVHQLWLESPSIDDEAIEDLERWKNLDSVVVIRGEITDNGLAQLSRLAGLVHLHVEGCPGVTDAGLVHPQSLQQLRLLLVLDTNAAPASGEKLQEFLPKCRIIVGPRGGPFYEGGPVPTFD